MKNTFKYIPFLIIGIAFFSFKTNENKGSEIALKADKLNEGWGTSSSSMKMILINKKGQKTTRDLHSYSLEVIGDGDKTMTVFDTPTDVKGTAFMTFSHQEGADDQWLYLPALNRVKRITSSNKSGPFMGSEFAYEDLSSQEPNQFTFEYLKEEQLNGITCHVVNRFPKDNSSGYKRTSVWYNKENYRIEKVVYYDRKDVLLKTSTFSGYKKFLSKYWRASTMKMVNHQTQKETILEFSNIQFGIDLTEEDFSQNALKRAK